MKKTIESTNSEKLEKNQKIVKNSKNLRTRIVDVFNGAKENVKSKIRARDLSKKVFSKESLSDADREFIVSLSKENLESLIKSIKSKLGNYAERIRFDVEFKEREPKPEDMKAYTSWKKLLDFIAKNRQDVEVGEIQWLGIRVQIGNSWDE